jgi:hypothetical protein
MPEAFSARRLGPKQVDQAYPILQSVMPELELADWRAYAGAIIDRPEDEGGIVAIYGQGYIHGLFSYGVRPQLACHKVLIVETIIVLDLVNTAGVATALLKAVDDLAGRLGAEAIHALVPSGRAQTSDYADWLAGQFCAAGYRCEAAALCKKPMASPAEAGPDGTGGDAIAAVTRGVLSGAD